MSLRHGRALGLLGTAFDVQNRTIDVRRIAPRSRTAADPDPSPLDIALHGPGRSNIPDVAIHLWRWQSWPVTAAPAVPAGGGRYRFSPLGSDMPLFSRPPQRTSFGSLTTRMDVPLPIARPELADFYGPGASILLTADGVPIGAGQVYGANLADRPGGSWCTVAAGQIAIDPELGRIQFAADLPLPQSLEVSYLYGFPAEIGRRPVRAVRRAVPARLPRRRFLRDGRIGRIPRPRQRGGRLEPAPGRVIRHHRAAGLRVADGRPHRPGGGAAAGREQPGHRGRGAGSRRRPARRGLEKLPGDDHRRHRGNRRRRPGRGPAQPPRPGSC